MTRDKAKTKLEWVKWAGDKIGIYHKPRKYIKFIQEKQGIKINPSDVTKQLGAYKRRVSGQQHYLEIYAKEFLSKAENDLGLAVSTLRKVAHVF